MNDAKNEHMIQYHQMMIAELQTPACLEFFNSIQMYQNPEDYTEITGEHLSQFKVEQISKMINNKKMAALGGKKLIDHYLSCYSVEDLQHFFNFLDTVNNKIAISLSANGHRIGIGYDGKHKKWLLISTSELPIHEVNLADIANKLFSSYFPEKKIAFLISIRLYATGNTATKIQRCIMELKRSPAVQALHLRTLAKALRRTQTLHYAAYYNHLPTIIILSSLNTDLNAVTILNETALYIAAYNNHYSIAATLLNNHLAQVDLQDNHGRTPLFAAAKNGGERMVSLLLQHRANPEITCYDKTNAITIAAINGRLQILILFSKQNIDILSPDDSGKTALNYAQEKKHQPMITYLMSIKQNQITTHQPLKKPSLFNLPIPSRYNSDSPYKPIFKRAKY